MDDDLELAEKVGEGWDGIEFVSYQNVKNVVVFVTTIWDTNRDAEEFLYFINSAYLKDENSTAIIDREDRRVAFILGDTTNLNTRYLLKALLNIPAT